MTSKKMLLGVLCASLLVGCGSAEIDSANLDAYTAKPNAQAAEGDFVYRLVAEKEAFEAGGPVNLYAELEYTGEQDQVDIYHAASPFYFNLYEQTREFSIPYAMAEPLIMTTLVKGEALREYYKGNGGYSQDDPAAYREFIKQIIAGQFPPGFYEVDGAANFYTGNPEGEKTDYDIHAEISFKVIE